MRNMRLRLKRAKLINKIQKFAICSLLIAVGVLAFRDLKMSTVIKETDKKLDNTIADYEAKIDDLSKDISGLRADNVNQKSTITQMACVVNELNTENKTLVSQKEDMYSECQTLLQRKELYDKYEYAVVDTAGNRTDITYDQLKLAETVMAEKGLDPNILLGIIMTESGGREKAISSSGSSARGYGQILVGTAKFVYEDLMSDGNYSHSLALNGDINIEMSAEYLSYLINKRGDLYSAIQGYRGKTDISAYVSKIDSYLNRVGTSVSKMCTYGKKG